MNEDLVYTMEEVIKRLHTIKLAREDKSAAGKVDDENTEYVKNALGVLGEKDAFDGEHDISAWLTSRELPNWNLTRAPDDVILALAREGLLNVKDADFRKARVNKPSTVLDNALEYRQVGESWTLRVERV